MRVPKSITLGVAATFILAFGLISAAAADRPHPTNHGALVSAVAKVKTNVGAHTTGKSGTHAPSNHGGAVSKAAHTKGTPIPIIQ
jgi:hypothetical protein